MFKEFLLVGCGGFVGTAARFLVNRLCATMWHGAYPLSTFLVNIAGCFLIGLFYGAIENSRAIPPQIGLLLTVGLCGGFTTFSTFASDLFTLGNKGEWVTGGTYLVLSIVLGILCVWAGRTLMR